MCMFPSLELDFVFQILSQSSSTVRYMLEAPYFLVKCLFLDDRLKLAGAIRLLFAVSRIVVATLSVMTFQETFSFQYVL